MQDQLFDTGLSSSQGRSGSDGSSTGSGLMHFNDIFSHFAKYIAPTYHHERPERSIQMRLYTLHKGQYLLIFIMFLCLFLIAVLMGMAGPRIVVEHKEKASVILSKQHSDKAGNLSTGPFDIVTPKLNTYRQQLWVSTEIVTKDSDEAKFSQNLKVAIVVKGVAGKGKEEVIGPKPVTRERELRCFSSKKCDAFILMHLGALDFARYIVTISFDGLASVDKHFKLEEIVFTVTTFNPEFTELEVWFRFFFVVTSIAAGLAFVISMRSFYFDDWSYEQKWTLVLLPCLIGYDNPIYALTLTTRNVLPALVDVALQANLLFLLLLFWLCIFHGLRQTERTVLGFYMPKVVLVGAMWFSAVVTTMLEEVNQLRDPSFTYELNAAHYKNFQTAFVVLTAAYSVYLTYLALRAFGELRSMNFLDARLKFHAASMVVVLCLTMSIIVNRYGSGVLEDNFIARIYTSYESEGQFLALYTVLNCYIYVLSYAYSPTSAQTRDVNNMLLKDNPALSMINESDEDDADDEELDHRDDRVAETAAMLKSKPNKPLPNDLTTKTEMSVQNHRSNSLLDDYLNKKPLILPEEDDSD